MKLTLGKKLPPAAAEAIARARGDDMAAAALARLGAPGRPARPASGAVLRLLKDPPPTPQSGRKQRQLWRDQDLITCRERFPAVFNPEHPRPLAMGMREELGKVLGIKRAERLLYVWTRWRPYLAAVAAGGMRYHLDGSEAGMIDPRHQAMAQEKLAVETEPQRATA